MHLHSDVQIEKEPRGSLDHATPHRLQPTGWPRVWALLSLLTLIVITAIGAVIRYNGFTSYGVWRDDAWAVLSSRVGIGTAWHMWVTAPGFYFIERTLLVLGPSGTWWAQLLPFVAGVACIPAIYALARYFGFSRGGGLILGVLVAASPVCATYSTRVKEYPVDFLTACLLIALAERARRRRNPPLLALGLTSVVAFLVSASLAPAIVALWLALGVSWFRSGSAEPARGYWLRRRLPPVAPLWRPSSTPTSRRR